MSAEFEDRAPDAPAIPTGETAPPGEAAVAHIAPGDPAQDRRSAPKHTGKQAFEEVKVTRTSAAWSGIVIGSLLLIVVLVFIVQNTEQTRVHLLVWWVELPLGVLLLFAVILGALTTSIIGGARMIQLWRAARRSQAS